MSSEEKWYSVSQVAAWCKCSEELVVHAIKRGRLRAANIARFGEPVYRVSATALAELIHGKPKTKRQPPQPLGRIARPGWILKGHPIDRKRGR